MRKTDIHRVCETIAKTRDKAVTCDLSSKCIHIKCNNLNNLGYEYLQRKDETWYCKTCIQLYLILRFCNKKVNSNKINLNDVGIDISKAFHVN